MPTRPGLSTAKVIMRHDDIVPAWEALGTRLDVDGANSRIWREGKGEPVVCLHGVPASSFVYRKLLPELATRGMEGIAFDFPGMGLADRPARFDYTWSGLARWTLKALDAAGLDSVHLVVHDIGGPIGFDVIRQIPERIRSLTVLNSLVKVARFRRPWVMQLFVYPVVGALWTASTRTPLIIPFMRRMGVHDGARNQELRAYGDLLTRQDGGAAFRKIMRGFERTPEFEGRIIAALRGRTFPAQVIWGAQDPALDMARFAPELCDALGLEAWHQVRGKHFLQEDAPAEIARLIASYRDDASP